MKIIVLTFKALRCHDAEKRAGLNMLLKDTGRKYGLKCINIEERDEQPKRAKRAKQKIETVPGTLNVSEIARRMREPDWRS